MRVDIEDASVVFDARFFAVDVFALGPFVSSVISSSNVNFQLPAVGSPTCAVA